MALKSYLIHPELLGMYLNPKHEVRLPDGKVTTYRLVLGDSELDMKKQQVSSETRSIYLGQRVYSTEDEVEQKFIESKPYFGTKITEYNPLEINKQRLADKKQSIDLLKKVASYDREEVMEVGYALFGREALTYIKNNDIDGLHDMIIEKAGNEPELVDRTINDKGNSDKLYAGFLVASEILEVALDDRSIVWGDNKSLVYSVPNGVSPIDGLTEFFQTKEGSEVKKEASIRLEAKAKGTAEKRNKTTGRKATEKVDNIPTNE